MSVSATTIAADEAPTADQVMDTVADAMRDASNSAAEGLTTEVTVDGKRSSRGESELRRKLLERGEIPGDWRFRQFFVLTPGTN